MTVSISATSVRTIADGILVPRPSTNTGNTPLGSVSLFAITGGRILLVSLIGEATTAIQAQATTVKFTSTPTTGSAIDLSSAATDLTGREVGAKLTLASPPAAASAVVAANAGYVAVANQRVLVAVGTISVTYGAASTGAIKYELVYVPYDAAPVVTAVA